MNRYKFDDSLDSKGKQKHIHTLNGEPLLGTSTVLNVLSKPLTWWASGMAVGRLGWIATQSPPQERQVAAESGLRMMKDITDQPHDLAIEAYQKILDEAYRAHSVKLGTSAQIGTDMHAELEKYVKDCIDVNDSVPISSESYKSEFPPVILFADWAIKNVDKFIASEAYCYSERLWTGGIVDLAFNDKSGATCLLDFKSAKEAYDAHFFQNAGYDIALSENGILSKDGDLIEAIPTSISKYYVLPYGMKEPVPQLRTDTKVCKEAFEHCVALHKILKPKKF